MKNILHSLINLNRTQKLGSKEKWKANAIIVVGLRVENTDQHFYSEVTA